MDDRLILVFNGQTRLATTQRSRPDQSKEATMTASPASPEAGSSLFSEPLLVVRQKPELVDSTPVYAVFDQNEACVGSVADVGRRDLSRATAPESFLGQAAPGIDSPAKGLMTAFNALSSRVREATYRLEVRNEVGVAVLVLTSAEFTEERSLITVARGDGATIGTITRQDRLFRKPLYALGADGQRVGTIVVDRRYEVHHHVLDPQEREVARIAPRRRGVTQRLGRTPLSFTVQMSLPLPDPLHSLLLAGALTADTALKRHEPDSGTSGS